MDEREFFERLRANPRPVVVDVWASWCRPCRAIEPLMRRLQEEYASRVDVWKLDADAQTDIVRRLGVRGIPTLIAFNAGQEVTRRTGAGPQGVLQSLFEAALSGNPPSAAGLAPADRLIRMAAAVGLLILGGLSGPSWLLIALAGVVAFTAVYDRCPLWQAISPRLKHLLSSLKAR